MEKSTTEPPVDDTGLLDLGVALGQHQTFSLMAGRCSAAQAAGLRRLREEKNYKRCTPHWEDFCPNYLKISRSEADKIIRLWEEFGVGYFEVAQLTRISPETYRAIEPVVKDGALHFDGEALELDVDNSRKIAAAVAELRRRASAKKSPQLDMHQRLGTGQAMHCDDPRVRGDLAKRTPWGKLAPVHARAGAPVLRVAEDQYRKRPVGQAGWPASYTKMEMRLCAELQGTSGVTVRLDSNS